MYPAWTAFLFQRLLREAAWHIKIFICPCFNFQGPVETKKPMQGPVPSIHLLSLLCSNKGTSITTVQSPTSPHAQRWTVFTMNPGCFQLCKGLLEPCEFSYLPRMLVIEKDSSPVTDCNAGWLGEEVIGVLELYHYSIKTTWSKNVVQSPVLMYILHNLAADAATEHRWRRDVQPHMARLWNYYDALGRYRSSLAWRSARAWCLDTTVTLLRGRRWGRSNSISIGHKRELVRFHGRFYIDIIHGWRMLPLPKCGRGCRSLDILLDLGATDHLSVRFGEMLRDMRHETVVDGFGFCLTQSTSITSIMFGETTCWKAWCGWASTTYCEEVCCEQLTQVSTCLYCMVVVILSKLFEQRKSWMINGAGLNTAFFVADDRISGTKENQGGLLIILYK